MEFLSGILAGVILSIAYAKIKKIRSKDREEG